MQQELLKRYIKLVIKEELRVGIPGPEMMRIGGPPPVDEDELPPHLVDDDPTTDSEGPVPRTAPPVKPTVDPYVKDAYRW